MQGHGRRDTSLNGPNPYFFALGPPNRGSLYPGGWPRRDDWWVGQSPPRRWSVLQLGKPDALLSVSEGVSASWCLAFCRFSVRRCHTSPNRGKWWPRNLPEKLRAKKLREHENCNGVPGNEVRRAEIAGREKPCGNT